MPWGDLFISKKYVSRDNLRETFARAQNVGATVFVLKIDIPEASDRGNFGCQTAFREAAIF